MRMTFGKYTGYDVSDLPGDYLDWVVRTCNDVYPALRRALYAEQTLRRYRNGSYTRSGDPHERHDRDERAQTDSREAGLPIAVSVDLALEIVKAGRRAVAMTNHPDKGGDAEKMVRANATADYLEKRLPQLLAGRN